MITTKEHSIQSEIMIALAQAGVYALRVNSGTFWGGKILAHTGDKLLLGTPNKIMGAPAGTSDIIGCKTITITPQMVGKKIGVFCAIEIKQPGEGPKPHQEKFLSVMHSRGAITGVAKSVNQALGVVGI